MSAAVAAQVSSGTSSPDHLAELLAAAELTLSEQDLTDLEVGAL